MDEDDEFGEDDWGGDECGCQCCSRRHEIKELSQQIALEDAQAGRNLDATWPYVRKSEGTTAEWCQTWREADRRPDLTGPVRLFRGGGSPVSMSWTRSPGVALAFANHVSFTTRVYLDVLGPVRLPLWVCEFPTEAILGHLDNTDDEFIVDIERFPPDAAARYEPTPEDVAAYRDLLAPMLPYYY
ncbi:MAG: hypothetical protein ACOH2F_13100 [Cellulomonas sp.]